MMRKRIFRIGSMILAFGMCLTMTAFAAGSGTGFKDVSESDYFCPAVQWGVEAGITNGMGDDRYEPQSTVTRAQAATFLWRMAGQPVPAATETFSDVKTGSWYDTAVQWAVAEGITKGTGEGKFSPDGTLDRAMCLTLLYRMQGSPYDEAAAAPMVEINENSQLEDFVLYGIQQMIKAIRETDMIFPDVHEGDYYELAVTWGAMGGILTDGNTGEMSEGVKFRPQDPCVRGEMISFLYQAKLLEDAKNAPEMVEVDGVTLAIPQKYSDKVFKVLNSLDADEDGVFIIVSEIASMEAEEALGQYESGDEGAGWLFSIGRVSEAEAQQIREEDIGYAAVFAKDANNKYYVFYHPTDVRYVRETEEQMRADQDEWTELVEWANSEVINDILKNSEGLIALQ